MRRALLFIAPMALWLLVLATTIGVRAASAPAPVPQGGGWNIPTAGRAEKNPLTVNDTVVAAGKKLFAAKCQRCHGPAGKGDGPDGEAEHQADMDLTVAAGAARNPDGVVFYKLWNGRTTPKMPAFSEQLTKEQAWAIVAYVQTLRAK